VIIREGQSFPHNNNKDYKMKLSKSTLVLLKNMATINSNLMIHPGSKLVTISANRTVAAEVDTDETFDTKFGIYDLSEFLGVLSLFENPEMEFSERYLTISEGKNSIRYLPSEETVLVLPKSQTLKFPADAEVTFNLPAAALQNITKSASILKVEFVTVEGDGEKMSIIVNNKANANSNRFNIDLGETDMTFKFNIKVDYFKMLPEDYEVKISSKKIAMFTGNNKRYMLSCETDSSFGG